MAIQVHDSQWKLLKACQPDADAIWSHQGWYQTNFVWDNARYLEYVNHDLQDRLDTVRAGRHHREETPEEHLELRQNTSPCRRRAFQDNTVQIVAEIHQHVWQLSTCYNLHLVHALECNDKSILKHSVINDVFMWINYTRLTFIGHWSINNWMSPMQQQTTTLEK